MADIDYSIRIRFDGLDAAKHEIDLFALGESLQGMARVAATVGHFAATEQYSRYFKSHSVRVVAREPKANCFSIDIVWNFVQQYGILSGSFGSVIAILIPYLISRSARKREEMKLLKDLLDKAIQELGSRDEGTINRLLDIVEKMATDLRPAIRHSVAPIGETCKTMTITSSLRSDTYDEADKAEIVKTGDDEITDAREFTVLLTELDLERGTCKAHIAGEVEDRRINSVVTDPILQGLNNPYSLSFAAGEQITVIAKALIRSGEIARLFISDVAI